MPLLIDVEARKAQKNYGVMANVPYIHNEHPKEALEYAVYDPYEEINRVPKMTWYIYKVMILGTSTLESQATNPLNTGRRLVPGS